MWQPQLWYASTLFLGSNIDFYETIPASVTFWPKRETGQRFQPFTAGLVEDYRIMLSSFYHQAVNVNISSTVTLDSAVSIAPSSCVLPTMARKNCLVRLAFGASISIRAFYPGSQNRAVDVVKTSRHWENLSASAARTPRLRSAERRR